jgi:hypothetical protein
MYKAPNPGNQVCTNSLLIISFPLCLNLSTNTDPMAVEGVNTPPILPNGGKSVPFGGDKTSARALSASVSVAQHSAEEFIVKGSSVQHVFRYPGSPGPLVLVTTLRPGIVVAETLVTLTKPLDRDLVSVIGSTAIAPTG